ncbi:MAG: hypothetical protein WC759_00065 [Candidatus Micrarchaeia archaeon]|jgi:hypothetical protein
MAKEKWYGTQMIFKDGYVEKVDTTPEYAFFLKKNNMVVFLKDRAALQRLNNAITKFLKSRRSR